MATLVYVEHHEGEPVKGSLGVLGRAAQLWSGGVAAVLCGAGVRSLAEALGRYGARKVLVADDPALESPLPQPRVDILSKLIEAEGFDTVVFGASVLTADVAAGLAPPLHARPHWDLVDLQLSGGEVVGQR